MSYNLFLDDVRDPKCLGTTLDWVVVRSFDEFVAEITEKGLPARISFDHDLAEEHYPTSPHVVSLPYDTYKEKTGYDCALWLIKHCKKHNVQLPKWNVHSMNPVGRMNIVQVLERYQRNFNPMDY